MTSPRPNNKPGTFVYDVAKFFRPQSKNAPKSPATNQYRGIIESCRRLRLKKINLC
jgi:hypothetical protein